METEKTTIVLDKPVINRLRIYISKTYPTCNYGKQKAIIQDAITQYLDKKEQTPT